MSAKSRVLARVILLAVSTHQASLSVTVTRGLSEMAYIAQEYIITKFSTLVKYFHFFLRNFVLSLTS